MAVVKRIEKNISEQLMVIPALPEDVDYAVILMDVAEERVYKPFGSWLKNIIKDKTVRAYHLEHCILLIDYLACEEGVPIWGLNLRNLKNFLFTYYPKKVLACLEQQKHLRESIKLIIKFMLERGFKLSLTGQNGKWKNGYRR